MYVTKAKKILRVPLGFPVKPGPPPPAALGAAEGPSFLPSRHGFGVGGQGWVGVCVLGRVLLLLLLQWDQQIIPGLLDVASRFS